MKILYEDQNCAALFKQNPQLIEKIRDPQILLNLAKMTGLDINKFMRNDNDNDDDNERDETSNTGSNEDSSDEMSEVEVRDNKIIRKITKEDEILLTKIKDDFMTIMGEIPNMNEYKINTLVYDAFIASDKDSDVALDILLDSFNFIDE